MIAPKPKSAEFIAMITPSLVEGRNLLSEFEIKRVISGARRLPERYQGLSIEGLVNIICDDIEEGTSLCEQAINLAPKDPVNWLNYANALAGKGLHSKQVDVLKRAWDADVRSPRVILNAMVIASFWADMDLLNKVVPMFTAMEIKPDESSNLALRNFDNLQMLGEQVKDVEAVAKVVMKVAEKHSLPPINSMISDDGYGMFAFSFVVDTDDVDFLSMLNNELIDEIIDSGLESSSCIGYFEPRDDE